VLLPKSTIVIISIFHESVVGLFGTPIDMQNLHEFGQYYFVHIDDS